MARYDDREVGSFPDRTRIYLRCNRCGNENPIPVRRMIERAGSYATIREIRERATCRRCGSERKDVSVQVWLG